MSAPERTASHETVDAFNAACPIGTPVLAFPGSRDGRALMTTTRSTAWLVGVEPVVMVEGYPGGIALTHVEVLPNVSAPDPTAGDGRLDAHIAAAETPTPACRDCEVGEPHMCPATPDADDASERRWRGIRCSHESCIPYGICLVGVPYPSERKSPATPDADDASKARAEAWHEGYASALSKPEIDKVRAKVLTDAADEWHGFGAGRGVMFNRDRLDLTPQQRVEKWLRDRAARIARGDA